MQRRWQDWFVLWIGAWLLVSPLLWYVSKTNVVAINSYACGAVLLVLAAFALLRPRELWEEFVAALVGAWLLVAPHWLDFSPQHGAVSNHLFMGLIIALVSVWAVLQEPSGTPILSRRRY